MDPAPTATPPPRSRWLADPPVWLEPAVWLFVATVTIGMRLYLTHLLPVGLWSKDAGSYAYSAFRWIHTGVWETDPRRGPVYSMLIALCGKLWGSINSLIVLQHAMGIAAILLSLLALRILHGRRALIPLALCGYAYGMYGLPLYLEHLVRNETLLFFSGTLSLVAWLFAIRWRQPHWLWITGFAAAVLSATKNVWLPFPVVFVVATIWYFRREKRLAITQVLIFAVAFAVPYMGAKIFKHRTLGIDRSDEPQEGVLLYGRTAQFTRLDGGIEPEIKAQIRDQVIAYQHEVFADGTKPPRLNNNEILKKTVVPHLTKILRAEGKNGEDLNSLCERLALEAIRTHPLQYAMQVRRDVVHMSLTSGARYVAPDNSEVDSQLNLLQELPAPDPIIHADESITKLKSIESIDNPSGEVPKKKNGIKSRADSMRALNLKLNTPDPSIHGQESPANLDKVDATDNPSGEAQKKKHVKGRFDIYSALLSSAWLFDLAPVLLTTLLLPLVWWLSPLPMRAWWVGAAGIWYFTVVLLSTVGRPLDRYLIPALPVIFLTLSTALILAWNALLFPKSPRS